MTTTITPAATRPLTFVGLVRSEWIKLFSLRSTFASYLTLAALSAAISAVLAFPLLDEDMPPEIRTIMASTAGLLLTQLVVAVHGVTASAGEYATGQMRTTLTVAPWRVRVLAAKTTAFAISTFLASLIAVSTAVVAAIPILGNKMALLTPEVLLTLLGSSAYLTVLGVLSLFIGSILRSTAGGVAVAIGLLLVAPLVMSMVPVEWVLDLIPYLPSNTAQFLYQFPTVGETAEHIESLLWTGGWLVLLGSTAALALRGRDA